MADQTANHKKVGRLLIQLALLIALTLSSMPAQAFVHASCADNTGTCLYLPAIHRTALPVRVNVIAASNLRTGAYSIVGTLTNVAGKPMYGANISARTYNQLNQLLDTLTGQTVFDATLPNQPNPFRVTGTKTGQVDRYEFDVSGFSFVSNRIHISPTVIFDPPISQGGKVGVLRNTSPYTFTKVIMALLTPDVSPSGLITSELAVTLSPGQATSFTRPIPPTEGPFVWANAIFVAQGVAMP